MIIILEEWKNDMCEECIGATIFAYWQITMYKSMFKNYIPQNDPDFAAVLTDGYVFTDFFRRMITVLKDDPYSEKYNKLCDNGFAEYRGDIACAYNIARSLIEVKNYLEHNASKNPSDWVWKNFHTLEYTNSPWSLSPLKFLFHRKVPAAGNNATVNVAKYSLSIAGKTMLFNGKHSANYKQIVALGSSPEETKGFYSIDTGNNGNIL